MSEHRETAEALVREFWEQYIESRPTMGVAMTVLTDRIEAALREAAEGAVCGAVWGRVCRDPPGHAGGHHTRAADGCPTATWTQDDREGHGPGGRTRWRHVRTGGVYEVVGNARVATNGPGEGAEVVVYRAIDGGAMYVRDAAEFGDGRFVREEK